MINYEKRGLARNERIVQAWQIGYTTILRSATILRCFVVQVILGKNLTLNFYILNVEGYSISE